MTNTQRILPLVAYNFSSCDPVAVDGKYGREPYLRR
jgi:hypothetical protein